jgi:HD superfamily phosphohydrolase YqeK
VLEIAAEWGNISADRFAAIYCAALYHDRRLSENERRELKTLLRSLKRLKSKGYT